MMGIGICVTGIIAGFAIFAIISVAKDETDISRMYKEIIELEKACNELNKRIDILSNDSRKDELE